MAQNVTDQASDTGMAQPNTDAASEIDLARPNDDKEKAGNDKEQMEIDVEQSENDMEQSESDMEQSESDMEQSESDMEQSESEAILADWKNVLQRCKDWRAGDHAELKALGVIVQTLYNDDRGRAVDLLGTALLEHDDLPAFYKAKMYAYQSACKGYNRSIRLIFASSWIARARTQSQALGFIPDEVEQWTEIIASEQAEAHQEHRAKWARQQASRQQSELPIRTAATDDASSGPPLRLGMLDGADEVAPGEAIATEPEEETPAEKAEARKAQQQAMCDRAKARDAEDQRVRHQISRLPKSIRHKKSVASFQRGEGSRGTLRAPGLRPKKSQLNLSTIFRGREDKDAGGDNDGDA